MPSSSPRSGGGIGGAADSPVRAGGDKATVVRIAPASGLGRQQHGGRGAAEAEAEAATAADAGAELEADAAGLRRRVERPASAMRALRARRGR